MKKTTSKKTTAKHQPAIAVSNCNFDASATPVPEYVTPALVELARAAQRNAEAISDIAKALKGADVHVKSMLTVGDIG